MALISKGPENDLLKATEEGIAARLVPEVRRDYQRIVLAGVKAAMNNGGALLRNLPQSKDPVRDCAIGGVNLTFLMLKEAKGNVPPKAYVPAAYTLVMEALDMAAKMKLIEVTPELIAEATKIATDHIFRLTHLSPQKLNHIAGRVNAITKDPAAMEKIELAIGSKRDPRAAMDTPGLQEPQEAPDVSTG